MAGRAAEGTIGRMLRNFGWVRPGRLAGMGRPEAQDWPQLLETGVRAVLSLTETPPPGDPTRHGLAHRHEPIEDFGTPDDDLLLRCTGWVAEQLGAERPVVVHCFAGVGRTGTVLAAVLVAEGMGAEQAIAEVRRLRPGSLETQGQVGAVFRLARRLGRT
jgi:atypical dual specificity phosphatase